MTTMPTGEHDEYLAMASAFTIFAKYVKGTPGSIGVIGGAIYAGPSPFLVSAEDKAVLASLGWHPDIDNCFGYHNEGTRIP